MCGSLSQTQTVKKTTSSGPRKLVEVLVTVMHNKMDKFVQKSTLDVSFSKTIAF